MKRKKYSLVRLVFACAILFAQATFPTVEAANAKQSGEVQSEETSFELTFLQKKGRITAADFDDSKGVVIFPVNVNGRNTWALLDTGSSATLINQELAKQLGLKSEKLKSKAQTPGGFLSKSKINDVIIEVPGQFRIPTNLGPVDKLIGPEACSGDMYEAEVAC